MLVGKCLNIISGYGSCKIWLDIRLLKSLYGNMSLVIIALFKNLYKISNVFLANL